MGLTVTQVLVFKRRLNTDTHQRQGHAGNQGSVQCCAKAWTHCHQLEYLL